MATGGDDRKRVFNCIPSRDPEKDYSFAAAMAAGGLGAPPALPDAVDLRRDWWPVGDQGHTGSCVGWAAADGVLRDYFVEARLLSTSERLSVRYVWMAAKETDDFIARPTTFLEAAGTSLKSALDIARVYGVVTEAVLPFEPATLFAGDEAEFFMLSARLRIPYYAALGRANERWKQCLALDLPILTRLEVDQSWFRATESKGKLDTYAPFPDGLPRGHAVCVVGYDPDGYIVRNSWGDAWGDNGFVHTSYAYAAKAFTEAFAILPN